MSKAKVSAVFITRDDAHLSRAVSSIYPYVEEVIVVDTGSSELGLSDTELEVSGAKVSLFTLCNDAGGRMADFSAARNYAFSLATQPYLLWLDSDDIVEGAEHLPQIIRDATKGSAGKDFRVFAHYEYAYDADGDCSLLQGRERIVNRDAWTWTRPVHEGLVPVDSSRPHVDILDSRMVWKHQRHTYNAKTVNTRDQDRNLRILERQLQGGPVDVRLHLDLGIEYGIRAQVMNEDEAAREHLHKMAEAHFNEVLEGSSSANDQFRTHLELSEIEFRRAGLRTFRQKIPFDPKAAEDHAFAALRIRDDIETAHFAIARLAYVTASSGVLTDAHRTKYEERAIRFCRSGLASKTPVLPQAHNPLDRKVAVHEWLSDCLARTDDVPGALAEVEIALETKPKWAHLRRAKHDYEATICRQRITVDLGRLHALGYLDDATAELARASVLEPKLLKQRVLDSVALKDTRAPGARLLTDRDDSAMDIVFSCGATLEPWNPDIMAQRGLGGSETAVIEMAKRLAAFGHRVRVYCTCGEEMERDGVQYLRSGKVFASPACDILVVWRMAQLLELENGPVAVGARVLWVHDVDPMNFTADRALLANRILALSAWHKEHLCQTHHLHPAHVIRTRNGLDLARFDVHGIERHPHRAVWSSSFDRGLPNLLEYWPDIRREIPDAELHVFYGNDGHKKAAGHWRDPVMAKWIAEVEEKLKSLEDQGVVLRGRLEQKELAKEFLAAGVLLYPTAFTETFCITAAEAQAAGLAVVTSGLAALNETVIHGALIPGTPDDEQCLNGQSYREAFINAAIYAMRTDDEERTNIMGDARNSFSWDPVAVEWETLFQNLLDETRTGYLPPYQPVLAAE